MRFLILRKGEPPNDGRPTSAYGDAMRAYEDELRTSGVVLASETLHPGRTATRLRFDGSGGVTVLDGPEPGPRDVVGGFYIVSVRSRADAVEWARRCPVDLALSRAEVAEIEIREIDDGGRS